jgi:hypothetical protein
MNPQAYAIHAVNWVNLLIPGHFPEAAKLISEQCIYSYQGQVLTGSALIGAFLESHARALRELDSIEYLPGTLKECSVQGVMVSVSDKISLNGREHIYRDQLLVRMAMNGAIWNVVHLEHNPIPEERARLREFLDSAGPSLSASAFPLESH